MQRIIELTKNFKNCSFYLWNVKGYIYSISSTNIPILRESSMGDVTLNALIAYVFPMTYKNFNLHSLAAYAKLNS